jgi:hypothetical protein
MTQMNTDEEILIALICGNLRNLRINRGYPQMTQISAD